jgi:hypothetical protein
MPRVVISIIVSKESWQKGVRQSTCDILKLWSNPFHYSLNQPIAILAAEISETLNRQFVGIQGQRSQGQPLIPHKSWFSQEAIRGEHYPCR